MLASDRSARRAPPLVATGLHARGGVAMWLRICGVALLGSVTMALCSASAAAARASAWSIQRTPNPAGARYSILSGLSCTSRTACTAVGYFTNSAGTGVTLAERWDGTGWSIQRTPNPAGATSSLLFGVSCVSTTECTAVGSTTNRAGTTMPLAERWNGSRWSIQRTPNPSGTNPTGLSYLGGVSCASATACFAVGYSGNSFGTAGAPVTARWDGTRWAIQRTPRPAGASAGFLSGVSCGSPTSCTAVGFFINRAGAGVTLAERWDGTSWSIERTPNPEGATATQLVSVSCTSPSLCTAVGFFTDVTGIEVMVAERRNGVGWVIQRTRYPAGALSVELVFVSCASARSCTAVGYYSNASGYDVRLTERWDGTAWSIQRIPNPAGATSTQLLAVSCESSARCVAVGGFTNGAGTGVTLAERSS